MGIEIEGLGTQDFGANTELMHSTFSRAEPAVVPFEVMEGAHTPETEFWETILNAHSWNWMVVVFWLS